MNKSMLRLLVCMSIAIPCSAMDPDTTDRRDNKRSRDETAQALQDALRDNGDMVSVPGPHGLMLSRRVRDPQLWAMRAWANFDKMKPHLEELSSDDLKRIAESSMWMTGLSLRPNGSRRKKRDHLCSSLLGALAWTASCRSQSADALAFFVQRGLLPLTATFMASGHDCHPRPVIKRVSLDRDHIRRIADIEIDPGSCCDSHTTPLKRKELCQLLTRMPNGTFETILSSLPYEKIFNTPEQRSVALKIMVAAALKGRSSYASFIAGNLASDCWYELANVIRASKVHDVSGLQAIHRAYPFEDLMPFSMFLEIMARLGTPGHSFDFSGMDEFRMNIETDDARAEALRYWVFESNSALAWLRSRYVKTGADQYILMRRCIDRSTYADRKRYCIILDELFNEWKDNFTKEQKETFLTELRKQCWFGELEQKIEASLPPKPSMLSSIGTSLVHYVSWSRVVEAPKAGEGIAEGSDSSDLDEDADSDSGENDIEKGGASDIDASDPDVEMDESAA